MKICLNLAVTAARMPQLASSDGERVTDVATPTTASHTRETDMQLGTAKIDYQSKWYLVTWMNHGSFLENEPRPSARDKMQGISAASMACALSAANQHHNSTHRRTRI